MRRTGYGISVEVPVGVVRGHPAPARRRARTPPASTLRARSAAAPRDPARPGRAHPARRARLHPSPCPPPSATSGRGLVEVLGARRRLRRARRVRLRPRRHGPVRAAGGAAPRPVASSPPTGCRATSSGAARASTSSASEGGPSACSPCSAATAAGWRPCRGPRPSCGRLTVDSAATMRATGGGRVSTQDVDRQATAPSRHGLAQPRRGARATHRSGAARRPALASRRR